MTENNSQKSSAPEVWMPTSWRSMDALQQPNYPDPDAVVAAHRRLRTKPPLVSRGEIFRLKNELAEAAQGKRFILHGGDCAERFVDCTADALTTRLKILLQMSVVLTYATRKPVIRIGRVAGQYAKPRSADTETIDGQTLPVYRGDLINDFEFEPSARTPNPQRMVDGYNHAAASLNYLRALIEGGFADLHEPEAWDLAFFENSPMRDKYQSIVDSIEDAIAFMETINGRDTWNNLGRIELYTSHEALLLPYEEALTRDFEEGHFNVGAHFLWAGYRTAAADGAHIEYLRGIGNPIGVKVGVDTTEENLADLLRVLDPKKEAGRLTLITRFGENNVDKNLERLASVVEKSGHTVVWSCDAMHGNTETLSDGRKTRRLEAIFAELEKTFACHNRMGTHLGGVHFELTGDWVTECIGGSGGITESDLSDSYETVCDPRLNGSQALELAFLIAEHLR